MANYRMRSFDEVRATLTDLRVTRPDRGGRLSFFHEVGNAILYGATGDCSRVYVDWLTRSFIELGMEPPDAAGHRAEEFWRYLHDMRVKHHTADGNLEVAQEALTQARLSKDAARKEGRDIIKAAELKTKRLREWAKRRAAKGLTKAEGIGKALIGDARQAGDQLMADAIDAPRGAMTAARQQAQVRLNQAKTESRQLVSRAQRRGLSLTQRVAGRIGNRLQERAAGQAATMLATADAAVSQAAQLVAVAVNEQALFPKVEDIKLFDWVERCRLGQVSNDRYVIPHNPSDVARTTDAIIDGLAAESAQARVYNFAGVLAYAAPVYSTSIYALDVVEDSKVVRKRAQIPISIERYSPVTMADRIDRQMVFQVPGPGGTQAMIGVRPEWVDRVLAIARHKSEFPVLRSVSFAPTITVDGSILTQPGYYPQYHLLLEFEPSDFPPILDTVEAAHQAYRLIDKVAFAGFQFSSGEDRSAAHLAFAMSAVRDGFDAIMPAIIVTAAWPASGKTLLMQTIAAAGNGRQLPINPMPADDAEMRKAVVAYAASGVSHILFDNVDEGESLSSSYLNAALTSKDGITDRLLGSSETITGARCPMVILTGNNISARSDFATRNLTIDIVKPSLTGDDPGPLYKSDPLADVIMRWQEMRVAVLTILAAAQQISVTKANSSEPWRFREVDEIIRSAYQALDFPGWKDPVAAMRAEYEDTAVSDSFGTLLKRLYAHFKDKPFLSSDIMKILNVEDRKNPPNQQLVEDLTECLQNMILETSSRGGEINVHSVGRTLRANRNRGAEGYILQRVGKTSRLKVIDLASLEPEGEA